MRKGESCGCGCRVAVSVGRAMLCGAWRKHSLLGRSVRCPTIWAIGHWAGRPAPHTRVSHCTPPHRSPCPAAAAPLAAGAELVRGAAAGARRHPELGKHGGARRGADLTDNARPRCTVCQSVLSGISGFRRQ